MFEHALATIDDGSLDARIEFVFMHRERGEGEGSDAFMDRAAARGIPVAALSSSRFRREHGGDFAAHRDEYDAQALHLLRAYSPDICVLAGYLLIMSPLLTHAFPCINLHPALPGGPVGLWKQVIWDLIDARAAESGLMTFLVTDELDKGPPITFARFPLRGERFDPLWLDVVGQTASELRAALGEDHPLFAAMREEGMRREPVLLVETLKAFARGEITVRGDQVTDAHGAPLAPRDLTPEVDSTLIAGR